MAGSGEQHSAPGQRCPWGGPLGRALANSRQPGDSREQQQEQQLGGAVQQQDGIQPPAAWEAQQPGEQAQGQPHEGRPPAQQPWWRRWQPSHWQLPAVPWELNTTIVLMCLWGVWFAFAAYTLVPALLRWAGVEQSSSSASQAVRHLLLDTLQVRFCKRLLHEALLTQQCQRRCCCCRYSTAAAAAAPLLQLCTTVIAAALPRVGSAPTLSPPPPPPVPPLPRPPLQVGATILLLRRGLWQYRPRSLGLFALPLRPLRQWLPAVAAGVATFPLIDALYKRLVAWLAIEEAVRWAAAAAGCCGRSVAGAAHQGVHARHCACVPARCCCCCCCCCCSIATRGRCRSSFPPPPGFAPPARPPPLHAAPACSGAAEQIMGASSPATQALWFGVLAVCAPIWEEIMFRGFLLPSLARYLPAWAAVAATSLIFAAVHFSREGALPLLLLGCVFGGAYAATRNLLAPILLHSLWNCLLLVQLLRAG